MGFKVSSPKPLVTANVSTATKYMCQAARLGYAPSQFRLGRLYLFGYFDPEKAEKAGKAEKAEKMARKLSVPDNASGRRASSASSVDPMDADINPKLAMHYMHLAARRCMPEADFEIARDLIFTQGARSSDLDDTLAYAHAERARFYGVPRAYGLLGKAHEEGIGCEKDLDLAEEYYREGGRKGDGWAGAMSEALQNRNYGIGERLTSRKSWSKKGAGRK
jgi:TPR repeat protein